MQPFKNIRANVKLAIENLSQSGFRQIFDHIDQLNIKKGVDKLGLDKFVEQCAWLAAGSGVISGSGGMFTMIIGMPVDMINLVTQQFRVTMAIMYYNKGSYHISFNEFMTIVASSFRVEAGLVVTKNMMEAVAEKMIGNLGTRTAERLVPVVGAAIGGTVNYMFIKRMARSIKQMQFEPVVIAVN
jgi:hypothetical protein